MTFLKRWSRWLFALVVLPLVLLAVHEVYRGHPPTSAPVQFPRELLGPSESGPGFPLTRNDVASNQTPPNPLNDGLGEPAEPPQGAPWTGSLRQGKSTSGRSDRPRTTRSAVRATTSQPIFGAE